MPRQPGRSWPAPSGRPGGSEEGCRMGVRDLAYRLYEHRLEASLSPQAIPRHVGVMCDGNRRWARSAGLADVSSGHQAGADKIFEVLQWCRQMGVEVVTLWLLSTDNLARPAARAGTAAADHRGHGPRARRAELARQPDGRARPAARRHRPGAEGRGRGHRHAARGCWSTSPSATAAAGRSPTRSGRCCRSTPPGAPRSRNSPRSSTSSTSPSTSTPRGSPIPTW